MSDNLSFETEELVFAFSYLMANRIIGSDGELHPGEASFMGERFSPERFRELRFIDARGELTPRWHEALGEALLELPVALSVEERLDLIELLWRAAMADANLHPDEEAAVTHGARLLGLQRDQVAARIESSG